MDSPDERASQASRRAPRKRRGLRRLPLWAVLLTVVAVLVAAEGAARWIGPEIPRQSGSEERAFIKADQIYQRDPNGTDVVILGSSETAGGLIPSEVLAPVPDLDGGYNAALAGARLSLQDEWAQRVVLRRLDPKVVVISMIPTAVIDVEALDLDLGEQTDAAYQSALDQIDPGGIGSLGWQLRQRSALIRYRPYLRSPATTWDGLTAAIGGDDEPADDRADTRMDWETETDPDRVKALTAPDGEVLDYRDPSIAGGDNALAVSAFTNAGRATASWDALEGLVQTIRDAGAEPVIALAPVDRAVLEGDGADLTGFDDLSAQVVAWADANDVPVHDLTGETWPPEWFHDRQHVALDGALAWSRSLGEFLAQGCASNTLPTACG